MNEVEAHRVKRDLQLNTFFAFISGCSGCVGAYMSKDGWNLIAGLFFLLSVKFFYNCIGAYCISAVSIKSLL